MPLLFSYGSLLAAGTDNPVDSAGQPIADIVAISAGSLHSLAVRRDGTLLAWGSNRGRLQGRW